MVPLIAGVAVVLLWCLGDWDWLVPAGVQAIFKGIPLVLLGGLLLVVSALLSLRQMSKGRLAWRITLGLVLLGINVPLDVLLSHTAADAPPAQAQLFVANDGPAIDGFAISGACARTDLGSIRSGDFSQRKFAIKRDGKLEFEATQNGKPVSGVLAERVTPADAPDFELTFAPDGSWAVENLRR